MAWNGWRPCGGISGRHQAEYASNGNYQAIVADFDKSGTADILLQSKAVGSSYLLRTNAQGKIQAISQVIADSFLGLGWSQTNHRILAGDFNGDGYAEVFLQAVARSGTNAIVYGGSNGQLASIRQSWPNSYLNLKWSTANAVVHVGDFNGDNRDDLLVQPKAQIALIDYDIPIPIPVFRSHSFGITTADAAGRFTAVQQLWSRKDFGVDWSPKVADLVIGDFNGDNHDDVLLVAKDATKPSYVMLTTSNGQIASSPAQTLSAGTLGTNWSSAEYQMFAADFDGDGRSELYRQAISTGGTNSVAVFSTGGAVTASASHSVTVIDYEYNTKGQLSTARYDDGTVVSYEYDDNGNRTSVTSTGGPAR